MKISTTTNPLDVDDGDALVIGLFSDKLPEHATLKSLEASHQSLANTITRLIELEGFSGKLNQIKSVPAPFDFAYPQIVLVGLGESTDWCQRNATETAGSAAKMLAEAVRRKIVFDFPSDHATSAICGASVGCHGQDLYKREKALHPFEEICFAGIDEQTANDGQVLGQSVNLTRRLVNQPPNVTFPESFAEECEHVAKLHELELEIWDEEKLYEEGCGSLLAVAQGSGKPPRLVIMRYTGGAEGEKPLALVGKGVTFDSGGLSLKPNDGMKDMKCDMAGAATVLGAMNAIAGLMLPVNVIGLVGLVENLVGADCYKLGDVLTARNGKTIEVLNTDAEGRLVLADVLDVANSEGAARIVDLATLTGACVVALGLEYAGLMTNDQSFCDQLLAVCETTGERGWQLPMDEFFSTKIKSNVADIKNIGNGRWGGAITAGKFLEEFVGETPWVHIDIAGPSFAETASSHIDGGGSGCFVRTLVELARSF